MKIDQGEHAASVLREFVEMNNGGKIGQHLIKMHWQSFVLPWNVKALLTSDRPVIMHGAMVKDDFYLMMPVGPKRVFLAVNSRRLGQEIIEQPGRLLRERLCIEVASRARKYVYGYSDADLPLVREHFSTAPQETIATRIVRRRKGRRQR